MQSLWIHIVSMALVIATISLACYGVEKRRQIRRSDWCWQVFLGLLFGVVAIGAMAFSGTVRSNVDNVQDMAPLLAGLLFGAPAGILAGILGGLGRIFLLPGLGGHVCYAAVISLVVAGLFAAFLRNGLFDDKKPSPWYGLAAGVLMAACHMMIFMLLHIHITGFLKTYMMAETFFLPLAVSSGIGMFVAMELVARFGKEKRGRVSRRGLAQIFQRWLLVCIVTACSITCVYTWFVQTQMALVNVENALRLNINDLQDEVLDASDKNLLHIAQQVAEQITPECYSNENGDGVFYNHRLNQLSQAFNVTDINLYDSRGINVASTQGEFCGYNMASGVQSAEFLILLHGARNYVQRYQPISSDANVSRKYAGMPLADGGFVQVGYDADRFHWSLQSTLNGLTHHRHIWYTGGIIIADSNGVIVSDSADNTGRRLSSIGMTFPVETEPDRTFRATLYGNDAICMYNTMEGYYIITYITAQEAMFSRNFSFSILIVMEIVLFAVIFLLVYFLVKKLVVDNIHKINASLEKITGGNLDVKVAVHSNDEFTSLSDDINSTVETLKQYIAEAAARIDAELEFARNIQLSALPSVFPPYPERGEFEIFATMDTAKEVGGDFYDFYFLGEKQLAFLIADVSGKGIPAALFMMRAKTVIKSLAGSGIPIAEVFRRANEKLCEGNDAGMFVTAWLGVLDVETGGVEFVNAGHNPPILVQQGQAAYLKMASGLMLGAMEGVEYQAGSFTLAPEDMVFLYTDGLPEAINPQTEGFGKDRVQQTLQAEAATPVEKLLPAVHAHLDAFVGNAEQFDDITMLALRFKGR